MNAGGYSTGQESRKACRYAMKKDEMYIIEYHDVRLLLTQCIFSSTSPPEKKTLQKTNQQRNDTPAIPCHERS